MVHAPTAPTAHLAPDVRRVVQAVEAGAPVDVTAIVFAWCSDEQALDPVAITGDPRVVGYHVEERVHWDLGPPPAITRVSFVRRSPRLTREQFADHWTRVHAPLARRHHPGLSRYAQNMVLGALTPGAPEVDGIAELGFGTDEDLRERMYDSAEGMRIVRDDVRRFIDRSAGWSVMTRTVSPPASP